MDADAGKKKFVTEDEARKIAEKVYSEKATQYGVATVPSHVHNGLDANQVSQDDIIPKQNALGNITMATDGRTYRFGLTSNPNIVQFIGIAFYNSGGITKRAHVQGFASLGSNYKFVDDGTGNSVSPGPVQNIIQCSSMISIVDGMSPTVNVVSSEENIVYVVAGGSQVAVATITSYNERNLFVHVILAANWTIQGNFVIT